jgi:hypothetical protein
MTSSTLCRTCGTDTREGTHNVAEMSADGNSVTFSCVFPRESQLPRAVVYLADALQAEYWYRPSQPAEPQAPGDVMRAHIDEAFGK